MQSGCAWKAVPIATVNKVNAICCSKTSLRHFSLAIKYSNPWLKTERENFLWFSVSFYMINIKSRSRYEKRSIIFIISLNFNMNFNLYKYIVS
ncbi:hypothetical protein ANTPLA_LOCUS10773 [Anthophora plagiata]